MRMKAFKGLIDKMTKGFVIERIYPPENLPCPLFAKEGGFLPFAKGGKERFESSVSTQL